MGSLISYCPGKLLKNIRSAAFCTPGKVTDLFNGFQDWVDLRVAEWVTVKASLWCVTLLINTRFRFLNLE